MLSDTSRVRNAFWLILFAASGAAFLTCEKRGRGLWGVKAYFADKDGWRVYNMQSASRGENRLSLAFSTPPGVEEVHFAVTFDNAPGIGSATKLGCSEFVSAE
jgi:hypothetical protein